MRDLALRVRELIIATDHYRQAIAAAVGAGTHETATLVQLHLSGPLTPTAIAESLDLTTASVTGLLDRLARAGFVTRSPNPCDRRSILVGLTEVGALTAKAIFDLFAEDVATALAGTTAQAERDATTLAIDRLIAVLRSRAAESHLAARFACLRENSET